MAKDIWPSKHLFSILASARLSILFNGSPVGFFGYSRGVRQGDPLSPLLFCLAEEVLSRGILRLVDMGHVQAISSPNAMKVPSHVLYADDIMVFCKGDKRSLLNLMAFFEEYELNSGQLVNKTKSHVYLGRSAVHRRTPIYSWLGVPMGKLPFMYLGVPIFVGRPKRIYFQVLADRICNVISNWRGHSLSMAGRVTLVNSVVVSMLSHSFTIYAWPRTVLQQVRNWMRNFIWTGNVSSRAYHLVSCKKCCAPLKEGGLGLSKLLCAKVSDFIKDGSWYCSSNLIADLAALWSNISAIRVPFTDMEDKLVWLDSSDGSLSLSIAYELKRSKQAIVLWDRWVWRQCFRPRNSITLWKFLHVLLGSAVEPQEHIKFVSSMGIATALEAKLQAIIHAVLIASGKGWTSLWIECDSAVAIHFLANRNCSVPWRLSVDWVNCCTILSSMQIRFSHIYREGNQVVDCLANYGVDHEGHYWWDSCPPCASVAFVHNLQGIYPKFFTLLEICHKYRRPAGGFQLPRVFFLFL
ncbi:putative RNA-directed DNA polymerase [Rosa chinensis]|uniref:Putative RNA-directed DNA polymerase n=1 Tax=Rosa chinensis TaxID=74649 RepID=A0A2P6SHU0_ROSCH|nr:putative RNA-directed DNA polymerase [Rosa chinensis]